ncbi:MAG: DNA starvation/stationary phase protection protein [Bacteroidota bacterium]
MDYLGFSPGQTDQTVKALNSLLANYQVYYQNLRNFHWNVSGENFFDLHEKFEGLYTIARERIDEIAERILTLRQRPTSTLSDYLNEAAVEEYGEITNSDEMVGKILENHAVIIQSMRNVLREADSISDEGTIDMVGGFLSDIEKSSWMLDAWLMNRPVLV